MHTLSKTTDEGGERRGNRWDTMAPNHSVTPVCLLHCIPKKGLPPEQKARAGEHLKLWLR